MHVWALSIFIIVSNFKYLFGSDLSIEKNIRDINNFNENFKYNFCQLRRRVSAALPYVDNLDIKYFLFTPRNKNKAEELFQNRTCLENSHFDNKIPTVFIILGTLKMLDLKNGREADYKNLILEKLPYNVLYVDYTSLNQGSYIETVTNSFLVSRNIKNFLTFMRKEALLSLSSLHIIGVSLGAEVAASVGYLLPGIGRITALDPVDKVFGKMPAKYKLDYTDALFVDIIHTTTDPFPKGFGLPEASGHLDFYPNGGKIQPGCHNDHAFSSNPEVTQYNETECSHERAEYLFLESINATTCIFEGVKCDTYDDFLSERCTHSFSSPMGMQASKIEGLPPKQKFYLLTNSAPPFCMTKQDGV